MVQPSDDWTAGAAAAEDVLGVLLAGGRSLRMGGPDKCLRPLAGRSLLQRAIERAQPQVGTIIITASGTVTAFSSFGVPTVPDAVAGHAGPLAGILAAMEWTRVHRPGCHWVASFATDAPFFPTDLVSRLRAAAERGGVDLACAVSRGRTHPVFALWPVRFVDSLRRAVTVEGVYGTGRWMARHRYAEVAYDAEFHDPFFNINRPEDLAAAEALLRESPAIGALTPTGAGRQP
ncbi:MAG: molybdenum cofactor guanylyltransferase MobA [Alphaproteobacteria bacterium]|nr:molybdenum cofactor guanylyltransferase MobA [Alphaproteobacteria bacterium]